MITLLRCLLALLLSLPLFVYANSENEQTVAQIKLKLEQLGNSDDPGAQNQRDTYQKTLALYAEADQLEVTIQQLHQMIKQQPEKTAQLETSLERQLVPPNLGNIVQLSLDDLEQQLILEKARQLELEHQRERIRQSIGQSDQKLLSLRKQLRDLKQNSHPLIDTSGLLEEAKYVLRNTRIQALELEILALPGQNDLNRLRLNEINRSLSQQNSLISALENARQTKRRQETEQTTSKLEAEQSTESAPTPIKEQIINNRQLNQALQEVLATTESIPPLRKQLDLQLGVVNQSYTSIQKQLELSAHPLGLALRQFTRTLSTPADTQATQEKINQLRLLNLETTHQLFSPPADMLQPDNELPTPDMLQLRELREEEKALLTTLQEASNRGINELSQLLSLQEQVNQQIKLGRELISRHLLWIPSILPVSPTWFSEIASGPHLLKEMATPRSDRDIWQPVAGWIPRLGLWLVLLAIARAAQLSYRRLREDYNGHIGNVIHDRFTHTLQMLILPMIMALPILWLLYNFSHHILNPLAWPELPITLLGKVLALTVWAYAVQVLWLNPGHGLLRHHFGVPERLCYKLRKTLHPLFWIGLPLVLVTLVVDQSESTPLRSGLGRLILILMALLTTIYWATLWKVAPQINEVTRSKRWWQSSKLWLILLALLHLGVIIAALMGYVFTGEILMLVVFFLIAILFATFLFFKLGNRWLLIEERRLAFDKAKARRNEILEAREKSEEPPPLKEDYIDLQSISDQARVLLKTATVLIFFGLTWLLLKNAIPALDILDEVVLWNTDITTSDGIISNAITLKSLLFSIALVSLLFLAAYNLPGVLELLVLRHISLSPGTSYAITSITKYSLLVISLVAGASQLGLEWSKLQWLIAALGVGLGFGLQEIVANFVSGLILLFEKPIRIGDTVTLGSYTGTVTRIQIRATTITDWDKKEVIIPNKNFVTDQLINWSLTDAVTRIVFPVGIAYGSDVKHAQQLLLDVARAHPKVLAEPGPVSYFLNFGNSTLDLELRLYVSSIADRLDVQNEINQSIDDTFKAHDIVIAFPQLDVHLHKSQQS